jgi:hypothetical protein
MNPIHFSAIARIIQTVLPHYKPRSGTPEQHLAMGSDSGQITAVTTRSGVELSFSGEATQAMTQIAAKMINLEVHVEEAPDIKGSADLIFVGGTPTGDATSPVLPFKCVYLPRHAPQLY